MHSMIAHRASVAKADRRRLCAAAKLSSPPSVFPLSLFLQNTRKGIQSCIVRICSYAVGTGSFEFASSAVPGPPAALLLSSPTHDGISPPGPSWAHSGSDVDVAPLPSKSNPSGLAIGGWMDVWTFGESDNRLLLRLRRPMLVVYAYV